MMPTRIVRKKADFILAAAAAVFFCSSILAGQAPAAPRVYIIDPAALVKLKVHPDKAILALAVSDAEAALKVPPHSVMEKPQAPPSGDKHDWYSQAGYWWPDPSNPKGPYIRHDGVQNPEKNEITDEQFFNSTVRAADTLALGYYLTGNEAYAAHAALLLRTWFLDPATAMNPNLNYAQFIPNKNNGRAAGIVSSREMPEAIDAVGLLAGSRNWTAADDAGMRHWFGEWYKWLTTSDAGKEESGHPNNHGTWYQVQAAALALYLGKTEDAKMILTRVRDQRIPDEIAADGLQKYEMARTKSFSYSAMNLHALATLATIAQPLGIDLWKPAQPGGPGILTAIEALLPYDANHPWPHEQIEANREDSICPALYFAVGYTHDPKYTDGLNRFHCKATAEDLIISIGDKQ
jgi:hypothetical protein